MNAIVFLDTEATGLNPLTDHIWEVAAIRVEDGEEVESLRLLVDHEPPGDDYLSTPFAADYKDRYDPTLSVSRAVAVEEVAKIFRGRAHMVGAVPSFDAERLGVMRRLAGIDEPDPWHYHLCCVEILAVGFLQGRLIHGPRMGMMTEMAVAEAIHTLPWDSDELSALLRINPDDFDRHTAMGDVLWAKAIYDRVMGGPGE